MQPTPNSAGPLFRLASPMPNNGLRHESAERRRSCRERIRRMIPAKTIRAGLAILFIAAVCFINQAHAVTITLSDGTVVTLADPSATTEGPLTLTGLGNQAGTNQAVTYSGYFTGGGNPEVGTYFYDNPSCNPCGGVSSIYATYQFVYDPGPGQPATTTATVVTGDTLSTNTAFATGDAYLVIGALDQTALYAQEDCLNGSQCVDGIVSAVGPLTNASITLQKDVVYTVQLGVSAEPADLGYNASAEVDPELFLASGAPGQIYYSDGITQAEIPEPGSLALLVTGVAGLLWRRKSRSR